MKLAKTILYARLIASLKELARQYSTLDADLEEWELLCKAPKRKRVRNNEETTSNKRPKLDADIVRGPCARPAASCSTQTEESPDIPRVTPLALQDSDVALLLQGAERLEREGIISTLARERYETVMRQYYEPYKPAMASIDTLGFQQLKELCGKLQLPHPSNYSNMNPTREEIKRQMLGVNEVRVANFLAEQTQLAIKALAAHPALLGAGALVRHANKRVVETAMVIAPVVFHDIGSQGKLQLEVCYRVASLDDMKTGYARNIRQILI